jgi:hypothetical protein
MIVAIAAGNTGADTADTLYADSHAPPRGLETCAKGDGSLRQGRRAQVAFACSLSTAIEWRAAQLGQAPIRRLIDGFGFAMPPGAAGEATPPSTAAARGLIAGSPRRVHHMAGAILAAMTGRAATPLSPPTLIQAWDLTQRGAAPQPSGIVVPGRLIRPVAVPFLRAVLQAPLCYQAGGVQHGTLKSLKAWCPGARAGLALHFAKTGTDTNEDPNQTVETWVAGGLRFDSGQAYSYVVQIGTGSTLAPFARGLNAGALLAPLVEALLADLEAEARRTAPGRTASAAKP